MSEVQTVTGVSRYWEIVRVMNFALFPSKNMSI